MMSTVAEIKAAISKLSLEDRAELMTDLCGWVDDDWDRQMKSDAATGKFESINRGADAAHGASETVSLEEIIREP